MHPQIIGSSRLNKFACNYSKFCIFIPLHKILILCLFQWRNCGLHSVKEQLNIKQNYYQQVIEMFDFMVPRTNG